MSVITSAQSGNWSAETTWTGGQAPTDADTFTIVDGHAVDLDVAVTSSGAIAAGGTLTLNAVLSLNGALTLYGDVAGKYSRLVQNANSGIVAGGNNITLSGGTPNSTSGSIWIINGTENGRVINTGATGKIDFPANGRVGVSWTYATIDGFLHATDCNRINGRVGIVGDFAGGQSVTHTRFLNGGTWVFGNGNAQERALTYKYENNDFRALTIRDVNNPYGSNKPNVAFYLDATTPSVTPVIKYNTFYLGGSAPKIGFYLSGATIFGNVTMDGWWRSSNTSNTYDSNYFGAHVSQDWLYLAYHSNTVQRNVLVSTYTNNHGLTPAIAAATINATNIIDNVFYNYETQDNPILIYDNNGDLNITNNIFTGGDLYLSTYGNAVTFSGQTIGKCPTVKFQNNTVVFTSQKTSDNNTGSAIGIESSANYNYTIAKNNLVYNPQNYQTTGFSAYLISPKVDDIDEYGYNNFYATQSSIQSYWGLNVSNWLSGPTPTYASATSFTVSGDQTAAFVAGVRIRLHLGTRLKRCLCTGSSYSDGSTTVTIDQAFATAALSAIDYSSGTNYQASGAGISGGGDIAADPQFTNSSRTFITFAESKGAAGTIIQKITYLSEELLKINGLDKLGTPDNAPAWAINDLYTYIREAYTPTNASLLTAGEGGTYIGAVQPVAPAGKSIWQKIFRSRIFH